MKDLLKAIKEGSQEAQDYIESLSDSEFLELAQELDKEANAPEDTQILRDEIRKVVEAIKGIRFPEPLPSPTFPVLPSPIDHKKEIKQVGDKVKSAIQELRTVIERKKELDIKPLMKVIEDYLYACQCMVSERPEMDLSPLIEAISALKQPSQDLKPLFDKLEQAIKDNRTIVTGGSGGIGEPEREAMRASAKESTLVITNNKLDTLNESVLSISGSTPYNFIQKDEGVTYIYYGFASSTGWKIKRKTIATGIWEVSSGDGDYATNWGNRITQTYIYA